MPYEDFNPTDYLDDMNKVDCMLVHEELNYRFSHRSFQEYFAAVYTTQLSDNEQRQFLNSWLIKRKDFLFTKLNDVDINTFGRKRKFESMLEEL